MVHIPPNRRLLYGAMVGAALPFVLNGGIGAFVSAKVAAFAQTFFTGLAAPLTVGGSLDVTTCVVWSVIGASFGLFFGNFLEGDAKLKCSYAVVMTAVIATLCVGAAINFQAALTTFFVVTTFGYSILQQLESTGMFSFHPSKPMADFDSLPGTKDIENQINSIRRERQGRALRLLLAGPPGTGKTSIAHAVAKQCCQNVIIVRTPDLHAGDPMDRKCRVQQLFYKAISTESLILFEEFEGVSRQRTWASEQRSDEITTLMGYLEDLNEIESNLIIIATTNYPESIDSSVIRPGRFDKTITVDLPNSDQRADIINYYRKTFNFNETSNWITPECTKGWSGADIKALISSAASNSTGIEQRYRDIQQNIERGGKAPQCPSFEGLGDTEARGPAAARQQNKELIQQLMRLIGVAPTDLVVSTANQV